ncbi:MAG: hypothetical protein IBX36_00415 [Dehalococcoidia bacterium]|nr:hypothetical protein [Dehalococcoidia bacterium]
MIDICLAETRWNWQYQEWAVIGDRAVVPPDQRVASARVFVGNPARELGDCRMRTKKVLQWW